MKVEIQITYLWITGIFEYPGIQILNLEFVVRVQDLVCYSGHGLNDRPSDDQTNVHDLNFGLVLLFRSPCSLGMLEKINCKHVLLKIILKYSFGWIKLNIWNTELNRGRMFMSEKVLLDLVCEIHLWVSYFPSFYKICLPFPTMCSAKLGQQGKKEKNFILNWTAF